MLSVFIYLSVLTSNLNTRPVQDTIKLYSVCMDHYISQILIKTRTISLKRPVIKLKSAHVDFLSCFCLKKENAGTQCEIVEQQNFPETDLKDLSVVLCSIYLLCPGVPWRLHIWLESLHRAQQLCRSEVTVSLLTEFSSIRPEDYSPELVSTGIPLMFRMLETSKVQLNTCGLSSSCPCLARLPGPVRQLY